VEVAATLKPWRRPEYMTANVPEGLVVGMREIGKILVAAQKRSRVGVSIVICFL